MKNPTKAHKPSLLAQQLQILGLAREDEYLTQDLIVEEARRMESMDLTPLDYPRGTRKDSAKGQSVLRNLVTWRRNAGDRTLLGRLPNWGACAAAAACILVLAIYIGQVTFWPQGNEELWQPRGESKVWVFVQRDGIVFRWTADSKLKNGDRLRAEVLSSNEGHGYMAVFDRNGKLLSGDEGLKGDGEQIVKNQRFAFPEALELTGADEGETLTVLICHNAFKYSALESLSNALRIRRREGRALAGSIENCSYQAFILR